MGFIQWHERTIKKITPRNFSLLFFGKILIILILGSMFSLDLVDYGYIMVALSTALLIHYFTIVFSTINNKKKITYGAHLFGSVGAFVLLFFFGIQSPQIPFKMAILVLGMLMMGPGLLDVFKKR